MTSKVWTRFAAAGGALGVLAAVLTAATGPAQGVGSSTAVPILEASKGGPVALNNTDQTLVSLSLPAGRWLITGKMWADSITPSSTTTIVVGCSIWKGSKFLDSSAFNMNKIGTGTGATAAGVNVVSAALTLRARSAIRFKCDDFGSMANAHSVVLTAVG